MKDGGSERWHLEEKTVEPDLMETCYSIDLSKTFEFGICNPKTLRFLRCSKSIIETLEKNVNYDQNIFHTFLDFFC